MQAIALFQTDRGLAWRIGGNRESVPTPEVALLRDQSLARTQILLRCASLIGGHHAGESKTPREGRGGLDEACEGGARRQGRRVLRRAEVAPMLRCGFVQRRVEIIAQG